MASRAARIFFGPVTTSPGTIRVAPVLFCAPVFWEREFWSQSAHAWDWVQPETPLEEKPFAEIEVSLAVTLGEVFAAACDAWQINAGPDLLKRGGTRENNFLRIGFVDAERDENGVDPQVGYAWRWDLPIARENGEVERVPALGVTYRELLASASLGLLEGDVRRPYVHPVIPQGDAGHIVEIARLTLEAIRAAYTDVGDAVGHVEHTIRLIRASLPEARRVADEAVDDAVRIAFVRKVFRELREKARRRWRK
jgi:hypothetical protein